MNGLSSFFACAVLFSGAFLSLKLRFFPLRRLPEALSAVFSGGRQGGNRNGRSGVTPFQAACSALGGCVGTANVAGVSGAIALGGPGAVFWMWVAGLLGMAVKYSEIVLALRYREKRGGEYFGGPMLYIKQGLSKRFSGRFAGAAAALFAFFGLLACLVGTPLVQANTASEAIGNMGSALFPSVSPGLVRACASPLIALLCGAVMLGGAKRIGRLSALLVPLMAFLYAAACLAVLIRFRANLLPAFGSIFRGAFGARRLSGGLAGYGLRQALRVGVARGVYSNEAGVGSAPIVHAKAETDDPVRQGLFGVFEVFADTLVMCTLTAAAVLASGAEPSPGVAAPLAAFSAVMGREAASVFLAVSLLLFAFTSLIGWSAYGLCCAEALFGQRSRLPFLFAFCFLTALGGFLRAGFVWKAGETLNYLMAAPNLLAVLALSGEVKRETAAHELLAPLSRACRRSR